MRTRPPSGRRLQSSSSRPSTCMAVPASLLTPRRLRLQATPTMRAAPPPPLRSSRGRALASRPSCGHTQPTLARCGTSSTRARSTLGTLPRRSDSERRPPSPSPSKPRASLPQLQPARQPLLLPTSAAPGSSEANQCRGPRPQPASRRGACCFRSSRSRKQSLEPLGSSSLPPRALPARRLSLPAVLAESRPDGRVPFLSQPTNPQPVEPPRRLRGRSALAPLLLTRQAAACSSP